MKRLSFSGPGQRARTMGEAWRRKAWITDQLTPRKAANLALAGWQWARKQETMRAWPVVAKVDISPLCNLHCTVCVHSLPSAGSGPLLAQQRFRREQRMPVERYREIVAQLAGRSAAVSLYYLGDPLMHPHLEEICDATRQAGLNAHVSTNFSFDLPDERLRALLASGTDTPDRLRGRADAGDVRPHPSGRPHRPGAGQPGAAAAPAPRVAGAPIRGWSCSTSSSSTTCRSWRRPALAFGPRGWSSSRTSGARSTTTRTSTTGGCG